jgi:TrpR family trp operon transcriptional repressor
METHPKAWQNFLALCLNTKNEKNLASLLALFLTPEEKEDITTRYLIVKALLKKEKTQRQIAKDLNVSIAKITRGSNEIKRLSPSVLKYLEDHLHFL